MLSRTHRGILAALGLVLGTVVGSAANFPGSLDSSFVPPSLQPSLNGELTSVAVQADGKILIAGNFTTINSEPHSRIGRLNRDGSLDSSFQASLEVDPVLNSVGATLAFDTKGRLLVGGAFHQVNGHPTKAIARLNPDGSRDLTFNPRIEGPPPSNRFFSGLSGTFVTSIGLSTNGGMVIGGLFYSVKEGACLNIAKLNEDGSVDIAFTPANPVTNWIPHAVWTVALQPDGMVLAGGLFVRPDSQDFKALVRYKLNGSLDTAFKPDIDSAVSRIVLQNDGRVLISGDFTRVDGEERKSIARLHPDATLDKSFVPPGAINSSYLHHVRAILPQPNGKIVVGGTFSTPRNRILRFLPDGQLDLGFPSGPSGTGLAFNQFSSILGLALQTDGRILVVGDFDRVEGGGRTDIARLYGDDDGSVPLRLSALRPTNSNQIEFVVTGATTGNYALEASTNLVAWSVLTNFAGTGAGVPLIDPEFSKYRYRFYRLNH
jgi:uncharacterized delta-60 repeat protein